MSLRRNFNTGKTRGPSADRTAEPGSPASGGATAQPVVGIVEWFRPGDEPRVEKVLADLESWESASCAPASPGRSI